MKRRTTQPSRPVVPDNPLESAYEAAADARDIIRDHQRRELPDYTDEGESTARHEMPQQMHVHVHQHSEPDLRETETTVEIGPVHVKGLPKWLAVGIAVLVAAATALLAARFAK